MIIDGGILDIICFVIFPILWGIGILDWLTGFSNQYQWPMIRWPKLRKEATKGGQLKMFDLIPLLGLFFFPVIGWAKALSNYHEGKVQGLVTMKKEHILIWAFVINGNFLFVYGLINNEILFTIVGLIGASLNLSYLILLRLFKEDDNGGKMITVTKRNQLKWYIVKYCMGNFGMRFLMFVKQH